MTIEITSFDILPIIPRTTLDRALGQVVMDAMNPDHETYDHEMKVLLLHLKRGKLGEIRGMGDVSALELLMRLGVLLNEVNHKGVGR